VLAIAQAKAGVGNVMSGRSWGTSFGARGMVSLEEPGTRGGERPSFRLITGKSSTRLRAEERLEVEARPVWPPDPQGPSSTGRGNGEGVATGDELAGAARREKPLNGPRP